MSIVGHCLPFLPVEAGIEASNVAANSLMIFYLCCTNILLFLAWRKLKTASLPTSIYSAFVLTLAANFGSIWTHFASRLSAIAMFAKSQSFLDYLTRGTSFLLPCYRFFELFGSYALLVCTGYSLALAVRQKEFSRRSCQILIWILMACAVALSIPVASQVSASRRLTCEDRPFWQFSLTKFGGTRAFLMYNSICEVLMKVLPGLFHLGFFAVLLDDSCSKKKPADVETTEKANLDFKTFKVPEGLKSMLWILILTSLTVAVIEVTFLSMTFATNLAFSSTFQEVGRSVADFKVSIAAWGLILGLRNCKECSLPVA